jgi:hypothetical protein
MSPIPPRATVIVVDGEGSPMTRSLKIVNRLTPEPTDVSERMRGLFSHGQNSGY